MKDQRRTMEQALQENLIGYLLEALDEETHEQVEEYLCANPDARRQLELLRRSLQPLEWDRNSIVPPPGLADRTLSAIDDRSRETLPQCPKPTAAETVSFSRPLWRRLDVLVAASLLIVIAGMGLTWINHLHHLQSRLHCEMDLKTIHEALSAYSDQHDGRLPNVDRLAEAPRNVAGLVIPFLISSGYLSKKFAFKCPGGKNTAVPFTFKEALMLPEEEFQKHAAQLTPCYGYSLGFRDEQTGVIHGPRFKAGLPSNLVVIMADCPPANPFQGNSPNHAGEGQNVLFLDGSVKFCTDRVKPFQGDDLYLSKANKVEAGLDWDDNVVGHSQARP